MEAQVAILETKLRRGPILNGESSITRALDKAFGDKAPESLGAILGGAPGGATHGDGCACCPASATAGCKHRAVVASNVIDRTFDSHLQLLRGRLKEAEAEIERLKSGETYRALERRVRDAEEEARGARAEADSARRAVADSFLDRARSRTVAPPNGAVAPSPGSQLSPVATQLLFRQLLLTSSLMQAAYDVKLDLLSQLIGRQAVVPPDALDAEDDMPDVQPPRHRTPPSANRASRKLLLQPAPPTPARLDPATKVETRVPSPPEPTGTAAPLMPVGGSSIRAKPLQQRQPAGRRSTNPFTS